MEKNQNEKKYALVTGGSSGIGMELSKLLAKDGYCLVIVAKPQEELDQAKEWFDQNMPNTKIVYHQQDLSIQGSGQKVYDFTTQNGYDIEILINNAGFGAFGYHYELDMKRILDMLNLLTITVWELTRLYVKDMVARDRGKILITSSSAALIPCPTNAAYAAGKVFSFYYGLAINEELRDMGSKVTLTVLLPPGTHTQFAKVSGSDHLKVWQKTKGMTAPKTPDFVAEKAYKALKEGKRFIIPGGRGMRFFMKLLIPLSRQRKVNFLIKLAKWGSK
jgi:short-subunit dehydrogenase